MATYAFVCQTCGAEFEVARPMSQRAALHHTPPPCPRCGRTDARKQVLAEPTSDLDEKVKFDLLAGTAMTVYNLTNDTTSQSGAREAASVN